MKKILISAAAFLLVASLGYSQTAVNYLYEDFADGPAAGQTLLDAYASANNENIVRIGEWAWGAYALGFVGGNSQARYNLATTAIWFDNGAIGYGSRIYTRLDSTTDIEIADFTANVNDSVLDASGADYGVLVEGFAGAGGDNNLTFGLLVRDNDAWYASGVVDPNTKTLFSDLQWQTVDISGTDPDGLPGADMEEVDDLGETGALVFTDALGDATPALDAITGFGIHVITPPVEEATATGSPAYAFDNILIADVAGPAEAPANLVATAGADLPVRIDLAWDAVTGAAGYNVYRSLTTGEGYTLLGSTDTNSFSDDTVSQDLEYFYVVTATDDAVGDGTSVENNEGAQSNEDSATVTGVASVTEWGSYR